MMAGITFSILAGATPILMRPAMTGLVETVSPSVGTTKIHSWHSDRAWAAAYGVAVGAGADAAAPPSARTRTPDITGDHAERGCGLPTTAEA